MSAVGRDHLLDTMRAVGASMLLTMRLFSALPLGEPRRPPAIVREFPRCGRFDPREHLPNGTILTLPLEAVDMRQRPDPAITLN